MHLFVRQDCERCCKTVIENCVYGSCCAEKEQAASFRVRKFIYKRYFFKNIMNFALSVKMSFEK